VFFALILALSMAFVFAGCSDGGGSTPPTPPTVTSWDGPFTLGLGGSTQGSSAFDATTKTITIEGSNSVIFYIDFAANGIPNLSTGTFKITYDCAITSGSGTAKVILKKGKDSWTDFEPAKYDQFNVGTAQVMTGIPTVADMNGLTFQHNNDGNSAVTYTVKITKLELE